MQVQRPSFQSFPLVRCGEAVRHAVTAAVRTAAGAGRERHAFAPARAEATADATALAAGTAVATGSRTMPTTAVASIADNVLAAFVAGNARTGASADSFASLVLPEQLRSPAAALSPRDLVTLLLNVRSSLLDLSTAAARLDLADPTSAFFGGIVTSTDTSVLLGQVTPGVSLDSRPTKASYTFTVSQIAVAQANVGSALTSDAVNSFTTGTNTFRITQNGSTTDVSFDVGASDTNLTVLTSAAAAVNAIDSLGVSAAVNTDALAGTSRLVLSSKYTGTTNAFSVSDVANTPGSDGGFLNATTSAQNAAYTLNGTSLTSESNDLYLGSYANLKVTLYATSSSAVTVTVNPDTPQISGAVSSLVSAYNGAKSLFDSYGDLYSTAAFQLGHAAARLRSQLANIGIDQSGGRLSIDASRLDNALSEFLDVVQRTIGDSGGFARDLHSIADTLLAQGSAAMAPLPPFRAGYTPQLLVGAFSSRLDTIGLIGNLVDALL
jgi:hypothetical protein